MSAVSIMRQTPSPTPPSPTAVPPSPVSQGSAICPTTPRSTGSGSIDPSLRFQSQFFQIRALRSSSFLPIHFPNAEQNLNLSFQRLSDVDLHRIAGDLEDAMDSNLQILLRRCEEVADPTLQSLVRRYRGSSPDPRIDFRGLREEFLTRCETHPSLQEQAIRYRGKLNIQLRDCNNISRESGNITSAGLVALLQACPDLESLDVTSCSWVNDEILVLIATYCPHLKILKVSFCERITDKGIRMFQEQRSGCTIMRRT